MWRSVETIFFIDLLAWKGAEVCRNLQSTTCLSVFNFAPSCLYRICSRDLPWRFHVSVQPSMYVIQICLIMKVPTCMNMHIVVPSILDVIVQVSVHNIIITSGNDRHRGNGNWWEPIHPVMLWLNCYRPKFMPLIGRTGMTKNHVESVWMDGRVINVLMYCPRFML